MSDSLKLWIIGDSAGQVELPEPQKQTDTEQLLEDALANHPDMLLAGLTLVGRQASTEVGFPDLLGIDDSGRLVVFELKRGSLTREAVAQVLDYGSYLDSLATEELTDLIVSQSGGSGTRKFNDREDFEEWHNERTNKSLDGLRPVRMVLVGLSVDQRAARIVEFLQSAIDISLITFHGFRHNGATILARHANSDQVQEARQGVQPGQQELYDALISKANDLKVAGLWEESTRKLATQDDQYAKQSGITFRSLRPLALPGLVGNKTVRASHSVNLEPNRKIRVTFFPAAVQLCLDDFENVESTLQFKSEPPPNAPITERVPEQKYCLLGPTEWAEHKSALIDLAQKVAHAWVNETNRETAGV